MILNRWPVPKNLRSHYYSDDSNWVVEEASALDKCYLVRLGQFDIVYSWGVLHHTGAMWQALENIEPLVRSDGRLFIAIYNDQGMASQLWRRVKQLYNRSPVFLRPLITGVCTLRLRGLDMVRDLVRAKPFNTWRTYSRQRGMSRWWDVVDWVGGYPFEVATPEAIFSFFRDRGFLLDQLKTFAGGLGCNESLETPFGKYNELAADLCIVASAS